MKKLIPFFIVFSLFQPVHLNAQWTTAGGNIHYNGGNVGIGVTSPQQKLHVEGTTLLNGTTTIHSNNELRFYASDRYVTYYKAKINEDGSVTRYAGRTSSPAKLTVIEIVSIRDKQLLGNNPKLADYSTAVVDEQAEEEQKLKLPNGAFVEESNS